MTIQEAINQVKIHANLDVQMDLAILNQRKDTKSARLERASIHATRILPDLIANLERTEKIAKVERIQETNARTARSLNILAKATLLTTIETLSADQERIEIIAIQRKISNIAKERLAIPSRAITHANPNLQTKTAKPERIKLIARVENLAKILENAIPDAQSTVADPTAQTRIEALKTPIENANLARTLITANLTNNAILIKVSIPANRTVLEDPDQMLPRELASQEESLNIVANQTLLIMIDSLNAEVERIKTNAKVTNNALPERASIHANQTVQEEMDPLETANPANLNIVASPTLLTKIDLPSAEVEKNRRIANLTRTAKLERASIHANLIQVERTTKTRTANPISLNTPASLSLQTKTETLNTIKMLPSINAEVEKTPLVANLLNNSKTAARVEKIKTLVAQAKEKEY